jgi:hypothetical protein
MGLVGFLMGKTVEAISLLFRLMYLVALFTPTLFVGAFIHQTDGPLRRFWLHLLLRSLESAGKFLMSWVFVQPLFLLYVWICFKLVWIWVVYSTTRRCDIRLVCSSSLSVHPLCVSIRLVCGGNYILFKINVSTYIISIYLFISLLEFAPNAGTIVLFRSGVCKVGTVGFDTTWYFPRGHLRWAFQASYAGL